MSDIEIISNDELMLLSIFIGELRDKSSATLLHFDLLSQAIQNGDNHSSFALLQSILLHSAQISLIFFPINEKFSLRGKRLCKAVGLADELNFISDRKIRNDIAHMDERIHDWHEKSPKKNIIRKLYGDRDVIFGNSFTPSDIFEHYIPSEQTFIFRGNEYDISKLFHCVKSVSDKTNALHKLHPMSEEFRQHFKN